MRRQKWVSSKASQAFTLTELLVVVGIIAVLTGILLPVLTVVRRSARQSACAGNLPRIGTACLIYAQESDGRLPPYPSRAASIIGSGGACVDDSRQLLDALSPYAHSNALRHCPADSILHNPSKMWGCSPAIPVPALISYHYSAFKLVNKGIVPIRVDYSNSRVTPSTAQLVADSPSCPSETHYSHYNHGGWWNRVFLDGHAASFGLDCSQATILTETP